MNAPFYPSGFFGTETSLLIAFCTGIAFGFILERAGFGSARKLAAQFYLTDLTVFKVMFTAVVTAMLGVFWLSWIGFLDARLLTIPSTYLLPQLVGGVIFGIGFVVGGYCPGTSCVASSTGRLDGGVHLIGMIAGILFFGESYAWIGDFYESTFRGTFVLPELLGLSQGATVFLIVLAALGGFYAAERLERRNRHEPDNTLP